MEQVISSKLYGVFYKYIERIMEKQQAGGEQGGQGDGGPADNVGRQDVAGQCMVTGVWPPEHGCHDMATGMCLNNKALTTKPRHPGRGRQDVVTRTWPPRRGNQDEAIRTWTPGLCHQDEADG